MIVMVLMMCPYLFSRLEPRSGPWQAAAAKMTTKAKYKKFMQDLEERKNKKEEKTPLTFASVLGAKRKLTFPEQAENKENLTEQNPTEIFVGDVRPVGQAYPEAQVNLITEGPSTSKTQGHFKCPTPVKQPAKDELRKSRSPFKKSAFLERVLGRNRSKSRSLSRGSQRSPAVTPVKDSTVKNASADVASLEHLEDSPVRKMSPFGPKKKSPRILPPIQENEEGGSFMQGIGNVFHSTPKPQVDTRTNQVWSLVHFLFETFSQVTSKRAILDFLEYQG